MKLIALALAGAALVAAGTAAAGEISDLDYLRASRCKGIAQAMGQADMAGVDAYLKSASRGRSSYISERSGAEIQRGKREAKGSGKARVEAEFASACTEYMAGPKDIAAR